MEWRVAPPNADGTTSVRNIDLGPVKPVWWDSRPNLIRRRIKEMPDNWEIAEPLPNGATIVLKIPGSTQWSGRGETSYYGTYFQVLRVLGLDDHGNYICETLIDFPLRNK